MAAECRWPVETKIQPVSSVDLTPPEAGNKLKTNFQKYEKYVLQVDLRHKEVKFRLGTYFVIFF